MLQGNHKTRWKSNNYGVLIQEILNCPSAFKPKPQGKEMHLFLLWVACLPWIRHILIHQFVSTSMLTLIILFWSLSSVHWSNLFFLCYVRASFVFKAVSAYQAWEGQCPMRKLWHGRFWMKKKTPTVFASCLWTGLLFETLSQIVGTWQLD